MGRKYGFSFSWKRATGISGAKHRISRKTGIPLTRSGRRKKVGRMAGCFVATATYGDKNQAEVRFLRRFRDEVLVKSLIGRLFVYLYYIVSPPVSIVISRISLFRFLSRLLLNKIIRVIEAATCLKKDG